MKLTYLPNATTLSALLFLFGSTMSDAGAESVYKCRNSQGEMAYQGAPCAKDVQPVSSWTAAAPREEKAADQAVGGVLTLKQRENGHYMMNGKINGKALTFVIDTGASAVSLSRSVAMAAQIYCRDQVRMQTANGSTSACTSVIPVLEFGPFRVRDVPAIIMPNLEQPLLGMNILQHFRVEQEGGEMRISLQR